MGLYTIKGEVTDRNTETLRSVDGI